jgi:kynurenine formamidase
LGVSTLAVTTSWLKGKHLRRIVDLSVSLKAGIASDPPGLEPAIQYYNHAETRDDMLRFFPGATAADLPDAEGWAIEKINLTTHNGTHLDAPYHYASTMNGGERAMTIDEVPLDWCFQNGVKLDFREMEDGYVLTPEDIDAELERIGYELKPLDIVMVNTSAGDRYGKDDYVSRGCGVGRDATLHLLRQGVRITGTDAWSWDAPFSHTAQRYATNGDASIIWEGHRAGREIGYCHIEKLHNLDKVPAIGFQVACFPVKIDRASAGWTRAVAIFEDKS